MNRDDLEAAAFWEANVCLACKAVVEATEDGDCPDCGRATIPAQTVLECVELVEEG